jgi:hypothetical protein
MIYSSFITKTGKYLKSVRILKNYASFDMIFPTTWVMLKNIHESIEVLKNESTDGVVYSFVCENKKELIDIIELTLDKIMKANIEREEKERLFKNKVQELKSIFEKENLENLKGLKFDMEELTKLIDNDREEATETAVTESA